MFFVDGIDINWEYPGGAGPDNDLGDPNVDGANYLLLIEELRAALDVICEEHGKHYELSIAIGVETEHLDNWFVSSTIHDIIPYLDRLGLMTYDFSGSWSSAVGFNSATDSPTRH